MIVNVIILFDIIKLLCSVFSSDDLETQPGLPGLYFIYSQLLVSLRTLIWPCSNFLLLVTHL